MPRAAHPAANYMSIFAGCVPRPGRAGFSGRCLGTALLSFSGQGNGDPRVTSTSNLPQAVTGTAARHLAVFFCLLEAADAEKAGSLVEQIRCGPGLLSEQSNRLVLL
ncbi:uncharacterized protein THITE_2091721 [Thermothielavioides terrestris NRRL 8126]|uniref:Uncharacterized protein n=1 Tax=Thermothielavioides terrestris (strain ATCC 38088 / NRRL 8126) TaxID=578455 RepID=G2RET8_THETT|nr:uncharacterized protein THITE_2091721 [Thermothielavioides terrestris NRRL 8126]AEO70221.1 hypothetical protein THITE_2091721 [Thermothielavioides terrestris NRRL 8126]